MQKIRENSPLQKQTMNYDQTNVKAGAFLRTKRIRIITADKIQWTTTTTKLYCSKDESIESRHNSPYSVYLLVNLIPSAICILSTGLTKHGLKCIIFRSWITSQDYRDLNPNSSYCSPRTESPRATENNHTTYRKFFTPTCVTAALRLQTRRNPLRLRAGQARLRLCTSGLRSFTANRTYPIGKP